jgi:predicted nuclease of predicted toxin-antitoxin system
VRFFLDHDVPGEVARVLRHEGYEVTELREVLAVRATDVEVFNYVKKRATEGEMKLTVSPCGNRLNGFQIGF